MKMQTRQGTHDAMVVSEIAKGDYAWLEPSEGDVILDVGGHIGAFAVDAALKGAYVVTAEPDRENRRMLRRNVKANGVQDRVELVRGALVRDSWAGEFVAFYPAANGRTGSGTLYPVEQSPCVQVEAVPVKPLLDSVAPNKVKLDCEGSEYELMSAVAGCQSVRRVITEAHFTVPDAHSRYAEMLATLRRYGFTVEGPETTRKKHVLVRAWR